MDRIKLVSTGSWILTIFRTDKLLTIYKEASSVPRLSLTHVVKVAKGETDEPNPRHGH